MLFSNTLQFQSAVYALASTCGAYYQSVACWSRPRWATKLWHCHRHRTRLTSRSSRPCESNAHHPRWDGRGRSRPWRGRSQSVREALRFRKKKKVVAEMGQFRHASISHIWYEYVAVRRKDFGAKEGFHAYRRYRRAGASTRLPPPIFDAIEFWEIATSPYPGSQRQKLS